MRLINADALMEEVRQYDMKTKSYYVILDLITNAPTVQREGWVSVSDRLPEYEHIKQRRVRVLVSWGETDSVFTLWYGHRFEYNSPSFFEEYEWTESDLGWIDENDNPFLGETLTYSTITHWMPLPIAPKLNEVKE